MISKRPKLIAQCADVADVIASVNFAREHQLLLAVRGGGHNGGGLGVCDDGLVIDLAAMRGIRRHFTRERGLPSSSLVTRGYWRLGEVDHPDHDYGDDELARLRSAGARRSSRPTGRSSR